MRRLVAPLLAANVVALATIGISYLLYSRLLSAREFGIYAAALAVGNLAVLILDGGVKVSIIKHATTPTRSEESALLNLMLSVSILLLIALVALRSLVAHFFPALRDQTEFVASFTAVYLLTYPWIGLSTASLERRLDYGRLAWIESTGVILERGAPVLFLIGGWGLYSFVWSLAIGRLVRVAALAVYHPVPLGRSSREAYRSVLKFIREGSWYQLGLGSSLVRDNLHIVLIGPVYGAAWVGYYAWGLQLCMMASQVFVQVSARISLPIAAQSAGFPERWRTVIRQVGLLAAITAPILAAVIFIAPPAVHQLFADNWRPALALLPFLCLRMLPGAASAPIGALVLVERGARVYALGVWLWTVLEVVFGIAAVQWIGAEGLAISYAVGAWFGIYFLLLGLGRQTLRLFGATAAAIFTRPALWASAAAAVPWVLTSWHEREWFSRIDLSWTLVALAALVTSFYALDSDLRTTLLRSRK